MATGNTNISRKFTGDQLVGMKEDSLDNIMLDAGAVIVNFEILGTLTVENVIEGDKIIIGDVIYKAAVITNKANNEFAIQKAAEELAYCINGNTAGVSATVDGNVITLTAIDPIDINITDCSSIIYDDTYREWELGITSGDNQYTCEKEIKEISFNGAKGKVKGMDRITNFSAKLVANVKELSSKAIALALTTGRVDTTSSSTHDIITATLDVLESDYLKNVALIAPKFGTDDWYAFILKNPLQTGNFDAKAQDKNEAVVALTFEARFDRKDIKKVPIEIRKPKPQSNTAVVQG